MHSLIIFASGKGSNAAAIIEYFQKTRVAQVSLIVSNRKDAGVIELAKKEQIPFVVIDKNSFQSNDFITELQSHNPALIVLAGFLWKIPDPIIEAFSGKIINIHPALLPEFGGKGMYGENVHKTVIAAGKKESGITIHYVDEVYDNGDIIVQARCKVYEHDAASQLADRIHTLEHYFFPRTIEFLLENINEPAPKDAI
ncbi:MAG TPA: phosphoribosylglycinamide formyltransferase [Flavipsychrobacter sp.]|nr:phosphoribosylglycinamide formyltransferase [Flavipsychrobacter sp.]